MSDAFLPVERFGLGKTDDNEWALVQFFAEGDPPVTYGIPAVGFHGMVGEMIKLGTGLMIDRALEPTATERAAPESLSATESAVLLAKKVDLVRYGSGGALLRAMTPDGMSIHLALTSDQREELLRALSAELPD